MPDDPQSPVTDDGLLEGDAKASAVKSMFDRIAPRYDRVNRIMTFGIDVRWRRRAVGELALGGGSVVLDIACGTGDLCNDLSIAGHHPIGIDFSMGMMQARHTDAQMVQGDALRLPFNSTSVDGVVSGFALRNFVDLPGFFAELGRVVGPGGRIALLDAAEPRNKVAKFGHGIYFGKVVPWVGGMLSDKSAYAYLPKSLAYLPPVDQMLADLEAAGFDDVMWQPLTFGAAQLLTATRRS
ncbi:MAG: ubiquinone/menaquinone biosynthesis methyltransferase [Actinomycetia bacterium]|nr:ubiquinone/menaquinone biosynthesis methyltransferase [Actinomycetes bacterium]